jgi:cytochrome c oxidase subunit 4
MKTGATREPTLSFIAAWLMLVLLAGFSLLSAFLHLGAFAPIVEFGLAATQAAIVFILFMRLKDPPTLKRLFAGAGFFWLLFLFGLGMTDYVTRRGWP